MRAQMLFEVSKVKAMQSMLPAHSDWQAQSVSVIRVLMLWPWQRPVSKQSMHSAIGQIKNYIN